MLAYKYGAKEPTKNLEIVREQMDLGRQYYNALIGFEKRVRTWTWAQHVLEHGPPPCKEPGDKKTHATRESVRREWWKSLWRRYRANAPSSVRNAISRQLRTEFVGRGLYWGTYLLVERQARAAINAASSKRPHQGRGREWHDKLVFRGRSAPGQIAASNLGNYALPSYFRLLGDGKYRRAMLRVGSSGRNPVWCEFPVKVHWQDKRAGVYREPEGQVRETILTCRRVGADEFWSLSIVTDHKRVFERGRSGAVAVDVGWRRVGDDDVKACHVVDTNGRSEAIMLPEGLRKRQRSTARIRSARDQLCNRVVADHGDAIAEIMDLYRPNWRQKGRPWPSLVARAAHAAKREGWSPPSWMIEYLHEDRRLWNTETRRWRRLTNARRDFYTKLAVQLSRGYRHVVVEEAFASSMNRRRDGESPAETCKRRNASLAAPGELRALLVAYGAQEVHAAYTTITCSKCGHLNAPTDELLVECADCGDIRNQDERACLNMLAMYKMPAT